MYSEEIKNGFEGTQIHNLSEGGEMRGNEGGVAKRERVSALISMRS